MTITNKKELLDKVKHNGWFLGDASDELKNDKEFFFKKTLDN